MKILLQNATIINEGQRFVGHVLIENDIISKISKEIIQDKVDETLDLTGKWLIPGAIDDQVHFREPGLTHKGEIETEARSAVAGGITTFMEMPNTVPNALTQELLQDKYDRAAEVSLANYSFFMGASNDNLVEVLKTDPKNVCGIKVFMGSSTGNMLVDKSEVLTQLFSEVPMLIATHCEDEATIRANTAIYKEKYGEDMPIKYHPEIRNAEACYKSSSLAVELAEKHNARLHILHISTEKEVGLFRNDIALKDKKITAEACIHHLWFSQESYDEKGTFIKWNPAVKSAEDRAGVWKGLLDNRIDIVATDHAPHTLAEKQNKYFSAPSGGPLVQHAIPAMLEKAAQGLISPERVVEKMSHAVAECFQIEKRGYIREGYYADLVVVNPESEWTVSPENILYKCGWSPFEGVTFKHTIETTFVNGNKVYDKGTFAYEQKGKRITFDR